MGAKLRQNVWPSLWKLGERLEDAYGTTPLLSAALLAFDRLSAEEQRDYLVEARGKEGTEVEPSSQNRTERIRETLLSLILDDAEVRDAIGIDWERFVKASAARDEVLAQETVDDALADEAGRRDTKGEPPSKSTQSHRERGRDE